MSIANTKLVVSEALAHWLIMKCDCPTCDGCDTLCLFEELKQIDLPAGEDSDGTELTETLWYCSEECLAIISSRKDAKP